MCPSFGCCSWGDIFIHFLLLSSVLFFTATKLRHFSDVNLGISIPGRREASDLLIADADGDKNDYDWWVIFPMFNFLC